MSLTEKILHKIDGRKVEIVFHVSSGMLQAALVYFQDKEKPTILYSTQEALPFTSEFSREVLFGNSKKAFTTICNRLIENMGSIYELSDLLENHRRISDVTLFFTTPWIQKSSRVKTHKEEKTFVVTESLLRDMLQENEREFSVLLDKAIYSVKLNGYAVNLKDALNKPAESLEVGFLRSTINEEAYGWFTTELERMFNIPANHVQAYPFSSVAQYATHSLFKVKDNHALLHVHAESTDLVVVKDNTLLGYWNLAYGRNDVLREIMNNTEAKSPALANAFLQAYLKNALGKKEQEKIKNLLEVESQTLSGLIQAGVKSRGVTGKLTGEVYVYSHENIRELILKHPLEVFEKTTPLYVNSHQVEGLCEALYKKYLQTALVLDTIFISQHAERYAHIKA